MKIIDVDICESRLAKQDKEWRFALAAIAVSEGWFVTIPTEDGAFGYGYASSMARIGAPHEVVKANLDRLSKLLIGRDSRQIGLILDDLDRAGVGTSQASALINGLNKEPRPKGRGIGDTPARTLRGSPSFYSALRTLSCRTPTAERRKRRGIYPS